LRVLQVEQQLVVPNTPSQHRLGQVPDLLEAQPADDGDRALVGGVDERLQPVDVQFLKCELDRGGGGFRHQSPPDLGGIQRVSECRVLERAPQQIGDRDDPEHGPREPSVEEGHAKRLAALGLLDRAEDGALPVDSGIVAVVAIRLERLEMVSVPGSIMPSLVDLVLSGDADLEPRSEQQREAVVPRKVVDRSAPRRCVSGHGSIVEDRTGAAMAEVADLPTRQERVRLAGRTAGLLEAGQTVCWVRMGHEGGELEKVTVYDPLIELMARFENVKAVASGADAFAGLGVEDALKKHIVDGVKKGLESRLESALEQYEPLQVINEILLDGMKTVGELFGAGKMQLPFVLQSAEVMKAAVRHLEPRMERVEGSEKGSILLATVAGDVHDIGKNLVDIILSNNGYRVVNIGIKQPLNTILEHAGKEKCQVIGLSGLLVKSTLIMRDNLLEMNERGVHHYPVILGGAALTRAYVEQDLRSLYQGRVWYAQDAFEGLRLMAEISGGTTETAAPTAQDDREDGGEDSLRVRSHRVGDLDRQLFVFSGVRSDVPSAERVPPLPFYGARKHTKFDLFELYKYVNPVALFRGQWQFRRQQGMDNLAFTAWLEENARPIFERLQRELASVLKPKVKWGYFPCRSEGNDLVIYWEDGKSERMRFTFPRQRDGRRLCLADFFRPVGSGEPDTVGFHIVTVGEEVSKLERELFARGDFQDYLFVHGMGVETAEALAEYWHRQIRHELGISGGDPAEMKLLFSAKYQGARYSFGYPACPNLEDQAKLFDLLAPEEIGIELSEEFMLVPEQSTSAIVVHHPEAKYFNVR
jgi:5-methyltetrahydrofolate--homocysteine methyltransferase